jgi:hypothetical protein
MATGDVKFECFICRSRLLTVCYVEFDIMDIHYCFGCAPKNCQLVDLENYEMLLPSDIGSASVVADEFDYGLLIIADEW